MLVRTGVVAALLAPPGAVPARAAETEDLQLAIKAVFLPKFAPFVEWPQSLPHEPYFRVCVAGIPPFGQLLDRAVHGLSVDGAPIVVVRLPVVEGRPDCRILFVSGSPSQPAAVMLALLRGQPILTVTDLPPDAPDKGIINFIIVDDRVRFEIDDALAARDGLRISSKLLGLAISVKPRAAQ